MSALRSAPTFKGRQGKAIRIFEIESKTCFFFSVLTFRFVFDSISRMRIGFAAFSCQLPQSGIAAFLNGKRGRTDP